MSNIKTGIIGLGIIILISMIGAIIWTVFDDDSDSPSSYDLEKENEQRIVKLVQNYQGEDQKGENMIEVLSIMINIAYSNEDIFNNPSTNVGWYAFEDYTKKDGVYQVVFNFETYREKVEYVWYVDTNDNDKIFAGDNGAKSIIATLNAFD